MRFPLTICAIFRNEASYLREWIEFHHLVGVDHFCLYQNRSDDHWHAVLQPYTDVGLADVTDWPMEPPCQMQAYQNFLEAHRGERRWTAFIDCDEFLFSPRYETLPQALECIPEHWAAVGVNWMCFGASRQETPAPGPVLERFTLRPTDDFGPNRHIKSIVRMDRVQAAGPDPHRFHVQGGTFSESGEPLLGPLSVQPSHQLLRINHYHTKSRHEYLQRIQRGNADGAPPRAAAEFDWYQAEDVDDRVIWKFLPALRSRLGGASA